MHGKEWSKRDQLVVTEFDSVRGGEARAWTF